MENIKIWHTPDTVPNDVWAYKKDVEATSKALDVAIDALYHFELEDGRVGNVARKTLDKINRIMKGGK